MTGIQADIGVAFVVREDKYTSSYATVSGGIYVLNDLCKTKQCRGGYNSQSSAKIHTKLEMADQFRERSVI